MTILIDNSKAVEISIREWDEENTQYGLDWSADFYDVGRLKTVDGPELAYIVEDVDYCIEQANDMVAGIGDFAEDGPQPDTFVDVTELDRSAYLICEIDLYQLSSEIYNHGLNVKDTEIISGMCPEDTIKVVFMDGTACCVGIDPNFPLCVNFSYYADESCRDGELSTSCHDFEGELDYLTGVKDICGGLR
jgi:hypothetical protein